MRIIPRMPDLDLAALAAEFEPLSPRRMLARAWELFAADDIAISFSGAEDVLLIELACDVLRPRGIVPRVFSLDTGRLHAETYRYFAKVEQHYGLRIEYAFPQAPAVEQLVRRKGLFSFYDEGHHECCGIRKVEPLARVLTTCRAWVTGQRRDQAPTRGEVPVFARDDKPGRPGGPLYKLNPLAAMSSAEVWETIRAFEVPYNPLHERGMVSIGCEPCTRAILPGQHEREGRWWWEQADHKECGLHLPSGDASP